jgi:hypothetical protein
MAFLASPRSHPGDGVTHPLFWICLAGDAWGEAVTNTAFRPKSRQAEIVNSTHQSAAVSMRDAMAMACGRDPQCA